MSWFNITRDHSIKHDTKYKFNTQNLQGLYSYLIKKHFAVFVCVRDKSCGVCLPPRLFQMDGKGQTNNLYFHYTAISVPIEPGKGDREGKHNVTLGTLAEPL